MMTEAQAKVIGHSLGVNLLHARTSKKKKDKKLPITFYRNRFCTSEGHSDLDTIYSLVECGFMAKCCSINQGESTIWYVTDDGEWQFREYFYATINNSLTN